MIDLLSLKEQRPVRPSMELTDHSVQFCGLDLAFGTAAVQLRFQSLLHVGWD